MTYGNSLIFKSDGCSTLASYRSCGATVEVAVRSNHRRFIDDVRWGRVTDPDVETSVDVIIEHSEQTARSAVGALDKPVRHCPGWNVRDLLDHLIGVHRFWTAIVEQRLQEPPQ